MLIALPSPPNLQGEFCSVEHQFEFSIEHRAADYLFLLDEIHPATTLPFPQPFIGLLKPHSPVAQIPTLSGCVGPAPELQIYGAGELSAPVHLGMRVDPQDWIIARSETAEPDPLPSVQHWTIPEPSVADIPGHPVAQSGLVPWTAMPGMDAGVIRAVEPRAGVPEWPVPAVCWPAPYAEPVPGEPAETAGMRPWSAIPEREQWPGRKFDPAPKAAFVGIEMPGWEGAPSTSLFEGQPRRWRWPVLPPLAATSWKLAAIVGCLVALASFNRTLGGHTVSAAGGGWNSRQPLNHILDSLQQRAAVVHADDFRSGLDNWESRNELTKALRYDAAGFVRPSSLAVYRPTRGMRDYDLEFLGQIERRPLGLAFRVQDWSHYYALKLIASRVNSVPVLELVHYAVVNGREVGRVNRRVELAAGTGSLYQLRLDVKGPNFTLMNHGRIVDYWADGRYTKGGVGFFAGKGESARLRWVQVSHQYDTLGRLCALLAPNDPPAEEENLKEP